MTYDGVNVENIRHADPPGKNDYPNITQKAIIIEAILYFSGCYAIFMTVVILGISTSGDLLKLSGWLYYNLFRVDDCTGLAFRDTVLLLCWWIITLHYIVRKIKNRDTFFEWLFFMVVLSVLEIIIVTILAVIFTVSSVVVVLAIVYYIVSSITQCVIYCVKVCGYDIIEKMQHKTQPLPDSDINPKPSSITDVKIDVLKRQPSEVFVPTRKT